MSKLNLKSVVDVANANPQFSAFADAMKKAGLANVLSNAGPFTVFVPTNAAFNKVEPAALNSLLNQPELLKRVLLYHVVAGRHPSNKLSTLNGHGLSTIQGSSLPVHTSNGRLCVGDAVVLQADIRAQNGVIHAIDTLLVPRPNIPRRRSYQSDASAAHNGAAIVNTHSSPALSTTPSSANVAARPAQNAAAAAAAAAQNAQNAVAAAENAAVAAAEETAPVQRSWAWLWWILLILLVLLILWALFRNKPIVVTPVERVTPVAVTRPVSYRY